MSRLGELESVLRALRGSNWVEGLPKVADAPDWRESAVACHVEKLTMPLGALDGLLRPYCQIMADDDTWQRKTPLRFASVIFAGDHELAVKEPISAYPQSVTKQMLRNFLAGGACHSVLASKTCLSQTVVDVGTALDREGATDGPLVASRTGRVYAIEAHIPLMLGCAERFPHGCSDPRFEDSLGADVAREAFGKGVQIAEAIIARDKPHVLILGEMGIGNTTSSAAIAEIILGSEASLAGRGTGVTDWNFSVKQQAIATIRERFQSLSSNLSLSERSSAVYASVAGFEHAALAGAAFAAGLKGVHVLLDGLIVTAALAPLLEVQPSLLSWLVAGHVAAEPAHRELLARYALTPLLHLGFRLGEGSGALLAAGLLEDAHEIVCKMATFEQAGVSSSETG